MRQNTVDTKVEALVEYMIRDASDCMINEDRIEERKEHIEIKVH